MKAVIYNSFTDTWVKNILGKLFFIVMLQSYKDMPSNFYLYYVFIELAFGTSRANDMYILSHIKRSDFIIGSFVSSLLHVSLTLICTIAASFIFGVFSIPGLIKMIGLSLILVSLSFLQQLSGFRKKTLTPLQITFSVMGVLILIIVPFIVQDKFMYPAESLLFGLLYALGISTCLNIRLIYNLLNKNLTSPEVKR